MTEHLLLKMDHDKRGRLFCSGITIEGFDQITATTLQRIGSFVSNAVREAGFLEHELNRLEDQARRDRSA